MDAKGLAEELWWDLQKGKTAGMLLLDPDSFERLVRAVIERASKPAQQDRQAAVAEARQEILEALGGIRRTVEAPLALSLSAAAPPVISEGWEGETGGLAGQLAGLQAEAAAFVSDGHEWEIEIPQPAKTIWDALGRLTFLLGLSDAEARFVASAAEKAATPGEAFDGLLVFADWLEDAMRPAHAEAVRRLVPSDGDVLVVRSPEAAWSNHEFRDALRQDFGVLAKSLNQIGRKVTVIVLPSQWELDALTPAQLLDSGLVTKRDYDSVRHTAKQAGESVERLTAEVQRLTRENERLLTRVNRTGDD